MAAWSPFANIVHDPIPQLSEGGERQRLGEHVGDVVSGGDVGNDNAALFYELAYEEMVASHVFHAAKVFRGL